MSELHLKYDAYNLHDPRRHETSFSEVRERRREYCRHLAGFSIPVVFSHSTNVIQEIFLRLLFYNLPSKRICIHFLILSREISRAKTIFWLYDITDSNTPAVNISNIRPT